ncbi:MAG: polymerase, sigma subunit, SigW [Clostridia bacterium]|nr:polymerase, sigma subunit, SigW [Clostridia bacterium]
MKDEDIIRLILKGDSELYSEIVDRYSSKVYSTAYSYTHNQEEARDLVQEILIKVYHNLHSFKSEAKFSTWLFRIVVNSCIDWSRKCKSKKLISAWSMDDDNVLDSITTKSDGPEDALLRQEHKELVRTTVASLPEIYKTVLILYYFEELQVQEICTILDSPRKTIETRLYRAKKVLKSLLEQELSGGELYELQNQ